VTGSVTGSNLTSVGGFAGESTTNGTATFTSSFYNATNFAAAAGSGGSLTGMTGQATSALKLAATYSGWDTNIWSAHDGAFPELLGLPTLLP
jgi:hypothetical protein